MANEEQNYTSKFKVKVAEEALDRGKQDLDGLARKYDVPVSVILTWTAKFEKNGSSAFEKNDQSQAREKSSASPESVNVEVEDAEVAQSISQGVMSDDLNYKRLAFWSILGMILVIIFVIGLIEMFQYNTQVTRDQVSEGSEYYQVNQLNREAEETLNSFGVVNLEEGIYRIPIENAMNSIAEEGNDN